MKEVMQGRGANTPICLHCSLHGVQSISLGLHTPEVGSSPLSILNLRVLVTESEKHLIYYLVMVLWDWSFFEFGQ
jgi:hypothetical protein